MNEQRGRNSLNLAGAVALALASAAAGAQTESTSLSEVIVTATKRNEALADIPMSVSVLAGDTLERVRATNFQDLTALVPGLSLVSNTPGITRVTLRGINTGGVASTVGIYVNDVPFGSSSGLANAAILSGDFDTFDMARIEVLRGPQGTLYGASSLGGVIKYVANEPSTEAFEGRLQGSVEDVSGGDMGYALTGVLNMPAGETFAVRASGFYRSDGGYIDSIGNNPVPSVQNPAVNIFEGTLDQDDINEVESYGGRVSALFEPTDDFSLTLTALFQDINSDNSDLFEASPNAIEPLYDGLVQSRYLPEWTDIEYRVYSATIDWDMGPVSLLSVTSWGEFKETFQRDISLVPVLGAPTAPLLTLLFSDPVTAEPGLSGLQNQITRTEKFTQEFRLVSPESDTFEWLAGVYYTEEDSGLDPQIFTAVLADTGEPAPGLPLIAEVLVLSKYEELALFANATWHISDAFDLSLGGRWSENDQEASQSLTILGGAPTVFDDVQSSESPFTWSISPRYEFTDNTSAYVRVATGFRPGGPNVLPPGAPPGTPETYDSDELTSYELGVRTGSADGMYAFDVAAFFLDWDDIQLFAVVNDVGINANGGTAESQGLEFTATMRPVTGLSLMLTGAYTDAQLTQDTDPVVGGLDGDPLPFVPEWSAGLGADYEWEVLGDSTAYVGGLVTYLSDRPADFGNRTVQGNIRHLDSYTALDLRTGLLRDTWSIELYAKNVTDEEGMTDLSTPGSFPGGAVGVGVIRPRTIGLSLGLRF
jgi:outer membrane receptor protein involved in Fe transport